MKTIKKTKRSTTTASTKCHRTTGRIGSGSDLAHIFPALAWIDKYARFRCPRTGIFPNYGGIPNVPITIVWNKQTLTHQIIRKHLHTRSSAWQSQTELCGLASHCTTLPSLVPAHRGHMGVLESQGEDAPKRILWYKSLVFLFYYEQQRKQELKEIHTCGCRCNERLKAKTDGSTRLAYTGLSPTG